MPRQYLAFDEITDAMPEREAPKGPQPRRFKKSAIRSRGRAVRWKYQESPASSSRSDNLTLHRWVRAAGTGLQSNSEPPFPDRFGKYNVALEVPQYDAETYEKHLTHAEWTKEETDYLIEAYREGNGKWPVVVDRYGYSDPPNRSMEDLKARFYGISATLQQLHTPVTSMTNAEYALYQTLSNFNAGQEVSRKKLAEAHLKRRQNEVDEEGILLSELQRIMLNQATLENEREELRRRLDYPRANPSGYQYSTSQALNGLWQQLLSQDRTRKNRTLRPTGNPVIDGPASATPSSARPREAQAGLPEPLSGTARRNTRDAPPQSSPATTLPMDLTDADKKRFGVIQHHEKLSSGVTFASDKLTKPRVAKSTIQTEKIASILSFAQVPDLIPLPTPPVIEQFERIMTKLHTLLDLRKLKDKEELELKVREAEREKERERKEAEGVPP